MATKSTALFSLTVVKDYVGAQSSNDDVKLSKIGDSVSERIETMTARRFVTRTDIVKKLDARGRDRIFMPGLDIQDVTQVRTRASLSDTWQILDAVEYELDGDKGILYSTGSVGGATFPCGPLTTELTWDEGFDVQDGPLLPSEICQAGLDWIKFIYDRRNSGAHGFQSFSIGSFSASTIPRPPKDISDIIMSWKRFRTLGSG